MIINRFVLEYLSSAYISISASVLGISAVATLLHSTFGG